MYRYETIVVGGGLVGSSVGYHLAREGIDTLLLDRQDEGRATAAGAGIIFPATSSRSDSPTWFDFAMEAVAYYPKLAADLNGYNHSYTQTGLLSVAVDTNEIKAFDRTKTRTDHRTEEYGYPPADHTKTIAPDRARELYPPLADVERAVYYEGGARVDGQAFASALRMGGRDAGLTVKRSDVVGIRVVDDAVRGITTATGETYDAENVVIAGGAWSTRFEAGLGIDLPVEPQRGQIIHLDVDPLNATRPSSEWPIVKAFRHQYQVPWPDGRVACGATREVGSGYTPHVTLEGLREVSSEALRIAPGLKSARHVETRVGLRPVSVDKLPILGSVPTVEGVVIATGHGATGLTLGPYSGKIAANIVGGDSLDVNISPFLVDRFSEDTGGT